MKTLKIIGVILAVVIILFILLGIFAPKEIIVKRSAEIAAPGDIIFSEIRYWKNWEHWSPWTEADSSMKVTINGTDGEVGAVYLWEGDPDITGKGKMVSTSIVDNNEFDFDLYFLEPWERKSEGYLKLKPASGKTLVEWGFIGKNPFPWNVFALFMDMDAYLGKDFERGLELLKKYCEAEFETISSFRIKEITFKGGAYLVIREQVLISEISNFFAGSIAEIGAVMQKHGIKMRGAPVGMFFDWDLNRMSADMAAGVPVNKIISEGRVENLDLPSKPAYMIAYYGPYEKSTDAHKALNYYISSRGRTPVPPMIEEYIIDSTTEPDSSKWLTNIYYFSE